MVKAIVLAASLCLIFAAEAAKADVIGGDFNFSLGLGGVKVGVGGNAGPVHTHVGVGANLGGIKTDVHAGFVHEEPKAAPVASSVRYVKPVVKAHPKKDDSNAR